MLLRALELAKKEGSKKVPVNFQVYPELKEEFENLCKMNNVSITAMLTALMESSLEEAKGIYFHLDVKALMSIHQRILELENKIDSMLYWVGDGYDIVDEYNDERGRAVLSSLENEKARLEQIVKTNQNGGVRDDSIIELRRTITTMHDLIENNVSELDVGFNPAIVKQAAENKLRSIAGIPPEFD
ncbi:MAG: hypothetical protein WC665_03830 [Sulfurimonas sp.]|jgi:hypothetical protein